MVERAGAIPAIHKPHGLLLASEHELDGGPVRAKPSEEDRAPSLPPRYRSSGNFSPTSSPSQGFQSGILTYANTDRYRFESLRA
jgi:hypothetical protein